MNSQKPYIDIKVPNEFELSVAQVARLRGCSTDRIYDNAKLDPSDRYYIKTSRNSPNGPLIIYAWDYMDYAKRVVNGTDYRGEQTAEMAA